MVWHLVLAESVAPWTRAPVIALLAFDTVRETRASDLLLFEGASGRAWRYTQVSYSDS
jgi:hypothetical protein